MFTLFVVIGSYFFPPAASTAYEQASLMYCGSKRPGDGQSPQLPGRHLPQPFGNLGVILIFIIPSSPCG